MEAMLNVQMSATLKERGDEVLRENDISASAAVRALWQELADTRTLPQFLQDATAESHDRKAKTAALNALVGVAEGTLSNLSDTELKAVDITRYE